ncbi:AraC family transcriptional regulator [Lacticaseibacillus mingshuiensis]|uniref:AraC family transcriptional regulator n=1 Tax=Lacticaseibacillus mingshuiensis TaxID=2799574 RepID=UPI00194FD156|nr:AraC family transcriptional regulator [Lacticaseibacillus mingshuiensis]
MQLLWQKFPARELDLAPQECGWQRCTPLDRYAYRIQCDHIIHFVLRGRGYLKVAGQTHELRAGQCFLLKSGTEVSYWPAFDEPWEYCWLGFGGELAGRYLDSVLPAGWWLGEMPQAAGKLLVAFNEQRMPAAGQSDDSLRRLRDLTAFFSAFCEAEGLTEPEQPPHPQLVMRALTYLNASFEQPITVQDVADEVHITRSYLYKLFMKELRLSPQQYLQRLHLGHAQQLLETTQLSIETVASRSGYRDALHFTKQFKAHYQLAPRDYRKQGAKRGV